MCKSTQWINLIVETLLCSSKIKDHFSNKKKKKFQTISSGPIVVRLLFDLIWHISKRFSIWIIILCSHTYTHRHNSSRFQVSYKTENDKKKLSITHFMYARAQNWKKISSFVIEILVISLYLYSLQIKNSLNFICFTKFLSTLFYFVFFFILTAEKLSRTIIWCAKETESDLKEFKLTFFFFPFTTNFVLLNFKKKILISWILFYNYRQERKVNCFFFFFIIIKWRNGKKNFMLNFT